MTNLLNSSTKTMWTEMELKKFQDHFPDVYPVRDGVVKEHHLVWYRCNDGPRLESVLKHKTNIREFPEHYSIDEPVYTTQTVYNYVD